MNNSDIENTELLRQVLTELSDFKAETQQSIRALHTLMEKGFKATGYALAETVKLVDTVGAKVDAIEGKLLDMETVTAQNTYDLLLIKNRD